MDVKRVTDDFAVAPQIRPDEVASLAGRVVLLVNNRPDGEEPGQPSSAEIEAAAGAAGLAYRHIPTVSGNIGDAEVEAFREALDETGGPVLAFCRTGTRSVSLWALATSPRLGRETVLDAADRAGYDLGGLSARLG